MVMESVVVEPLNKDAAKVADSLTRLYWISPVTRTITERIATDQTTTDGQRIYKDGKVREVSPIISIQGRAFQMPAVGEPVDVPSHLVKQIKEQSRIFDPRSKRLIEAFTEDPMYAKTVAKAIKEGKEIPRNFAEVARNEVENMSIEEIEAMLEARKAQESVPEEADKKSSRSTSKSTGDK